MEARVIFADEELKKTFESLKSENERLYKEIEEALKNDQTKCFFW